MSNLNLSRAIVAGHICRDLELKQTPNGTPCTTFSVAVNRKSEGENAIVTDYHTIIAFSKLAEHICRYFRKGSAIYVDGKLRIRSYTDKNGVNRKVPEIIASDVSFVDSKANTPEIEEQPQSVEIAVPASMAELQNSTDDDLPF